MDNNPLYKNILPVQVRFSDVDMMGHVSNTVYQNYFDSGKLHYFDIVLPDMDFVSIGVVNASVKIEYLKPIFIKTRILVESRVTVIGNKSITMEHRLVDELSQEILSTCTVVMVCYAIKEQVSQSIPEHWKKSILAYDSGVILKI